MPKRYRLIPVHVEAIQLIDSDSVKRAETWAGGFAVTGIDPVTSTLKFLALNVPTERNIERAELGDYVVKDTRGAVRVIKRDEFEAQYELI